MSKYSDILPEIKKADLKLKMILNEVSQMRVKCAKMQLDILSLYKPECLEILEMLKANECGENSLNETSPVEKSHSQANSTS